MSAESRVRARDTPGLELSVPPRAGRTTERLHPALALPLAILALYLLTATWQAPYNVDAFTNAVQARSFAADASPIIEEAEGLTAPQYQGTLAWLTDSPDGPTSQYPPGAALWGALFYLADTSQDIERVTWSNAYTGEGGEVDLAVPSFAPAAVASALSVALAMMFFSLTMRRLTDPRTAAIATLVAALGTGAWSVASDKLWQHGPAMMFISLGTYLSSRNRFAGAGLACGGAVLVRPHTALVAAGIGLAVSISRRTVWPALRMGATSALGLVAVVAYNAWVFDEASISGGYGSTFTDRVQSPNPFVLLERVVLAFVDADVGMLLTSPFLAVSLLGIAAVRKTAPDWAIGAALGGAGYLLLQYQANRVSGGEGFFSYRYPLEALMAAAPLLALSTKAWIDGNETRTRLFAVLAGVSVLFHGYGAVFL